MKNGDEKRALQAERKAIQETRKARLSVVEELYKQLKPGSTKKAQAERDSMEGAACINYGSSQQLLEALLKGPFDLDPRKFTSTNKTNMIPWSKLPEISAILQFRGLQKQLSTYGEAWIKTRDELIDVEKKLKGHVDPDTGRIHGRFLQLGADTGRPSCTKPNLLNIPRSEEVRGCFQARPGYVMVCKDCAGQELRIVAEYSQERAWLEAFRNGQDVHSISGEMFYAEPWRKAALPSCAYYTKNKAKCSCPDHKVQRDKLKGVNLGVIFDKQAYSLSLELGINETEAELLLRKWHTTFKKNSDKLAWFRDTFYEKGEARDLAGRRRYTTKVTEEQAHKAFFARYNRVPTDAELFKTVNSLVAGVKRELGNFPIQGSAATMMKLAMGCGFDPNGKPYLWHILEPDYGALLELYLYDEFVTESPEEHGEVVSEIVSDAIIRAGAEFVKSVPMTSEGAVTKKWKK
jgi:DNA polymerase I-like protein with 3'-5' exonuclease and polymerase domains